MDTQNKTVAITKAYLSAKRLEHMLEYKLNPEVAAAFVREIRMILRPFISDEARLFDC